VPHSPLKRSRSAPLYSKRREMGVKKVWREEIIEGVMKERLRFGRRVGFGVGVGGVAIGKHLPVCHPSHRSARAIPFNADAM